MIFSGVANIHFCAKGDGRPCCVKDLKIPNFGLECGGRIATSGDCYHTDQVSAPIPPKIICTIHQAEGED